MNEPHPVSDIDSLFRLPLESFAPLFQSQTLPKNVLTKERILDPHQGAAVEFFRSKKTGGGMRSVPETVKELNLTERDRIILTALADLPSYDPFSLRKALRGSIYQLNERFRPEGIVLELPDNLPIFQLSHDMQTRLSGYTKLFTKPLVRLLLRGGDETANEGVETPADLIALVTRARESSDHETIDRLRKNLLNVGRIVGSTDLKKIACLSG